MYIYTLLHTLCGTAFLQSSKNDVLDKKEKLLIFLMVAKVTCFFTSSLSYMVPAPLIFICIVSFVMSVESVGRSFAHGALSSSDGFSLTSML